MGAKGSSVGAATASSPADAGAATAAFTASTTALEVTVAPASASMPSPMATGAVLPTNCAAKAASSMQRVPKPAVSLAESITMPLIAPAASMVSLTVTSDWKPRAVPTSTSPVSSICSTGAFSATPKASTGSVRPLPITVLTAASALLAAFRTAVEVTVAPDSASMLPPAVTSIPLNCSHLSSASQREPKPFVSTKFVSPIFAPVILPSLPTPRVTATGPA